MLICDPLNSFEEPLNEASPKEGYIDAKKIIVYGAIDPLRTVKEKMMSLIGSLCSLDRDAFKPPWFKTLFAADARIVQKLIKSSLIIPAKQGIL